jgi:hypothetical protein
VHDRQRTRREPADAVRVEDVIPAEILNDTRVDREYLEQVFREPQKYLPPRAKPEPRPKPEQPPQEPESRFARRAKLVGLVAAGALVAGSIITASTLTSQHRAQSPVEPAGVRQITGAAALGGFAVPEPPSSSTQGQAKNSKPHTKQTTVAPAAETGPRGAEPGTPVTPPPSSSKPATPSQGSATTTADAKLAAVKSFYSMVDLDPQGALAMLEPLLAGEQPGSLVRAWSSMDAVQVEDARIQPDGSIIAVVTMVQPDGAHLRITQLLRVAEDSSGMISDARLLSTQQM